LRAKGKLPDTNEAIAFMICTIAFFEIAALLKYIHRGQDLGIGFNKKSASFEKQA